MSAIPYEPNAKDKLDVLDWNGLPAGRCDLNFRKPSSHAASDWYRTLLRLLAIGFVTVIVGIIVRTHVAERLFSAEMIGTVTMVALAMMMVVWLGAFRVLPIWDGPTTKTTLLTVGGVFGLWLVAGMLCATSLGGLLLLLWVAVPLAISVADSLATHWVHWCTANPRIDRVTMTGWREDWRRRFAGMPDRPLRSDVASLQSRQAHAWAMRLRRFYPWGFIWLAVPFVVVPAVVIALTLLGIVERAEFWLVVEITLVLLWLAVVRSVQAPGSWTVYRAALASWAQYGRNLVDPQWVFQSPAGPHLQRTVLLFFSVVAMAISLFAILSAEIAHTVHPLASQAGMDSFAVTLLLLILAAAVVLPGLWLILIGYLFTAPALAAVHLACEADGAFEQHADWTELDGYFERLRNSRNAEEARHMMIGYNTTHEYPYLLDSDLLFEHCHVLGATGIGKTALGLATHTIQLIRRNDGPVIIVDCKGDPAFFHTAKIEAERAGRTFKWFTNKPHRSTYVFNPLDQPHLPGLTLPEMIGLVTQSLNLHHGDDYGRAWFSIGSRVLLKAGLLTTTRPDSPWARPSRRYTVGGHPPVQSFRDLEAILDAVAADDEEYKNGKHLLFLVESLADFEQLNLAPNRAPHHPALRHAIHMPQVIEQNQVVYFYLVGALDIASVGELARMVLYSALSAAIAHRDRTGQRPRVYFVADEAQALAAKNLEVVLAQAREHGLACTLAHQTMSQLNPPGGVDLRELVMNCTAVKQYFSARDPLLQKFISQASGTVRYWEASWQQLPKDVRRGAIGRQFASAATKDERPLVGIHERLGFRLESEDLNDISRHLNQSVFSVDRCSGYSRFVGAFPMHSDFPVAKDVHNERRERLPWPEGGDATLTNSGLWPAGNAGTITPTRHPGPGVPDPGSDVQKRLQDIREQLENDQ